MAIRQVSTKFVAALLASLAVLTFILTCQTVDKVNAADKVYTDGPLSVAPGKLPQQRGQAQRSISYYTRAIALKANDASLYVSRAKAYNKISKFQLALPDFDRALALNPNLQDAYLGRAWANDQLDNFAAAEKDYKKYLSLGDTIMSGMAAFSLADNLAQQNKQEEAIKILNTVISHNPKAGQARRLRGNLINAAGGNPKLAAEDFTVAIEQKVDCYRDIYPLRASAYVRTKQYQKAIDDYTTMLKLSPNDDNAFRKRAAVYELMGDYKKAIADYSKGIDQSLEGAGPFYFGRARCYNKIGEAALAQKDLEACQRLDYKEKIKLDRQG